MYVLEKLIYYKAVEYLYLKLMLFSNEIQRIIHKHVIFNSYKKVFV